MKKPTYLETLRARAQKEWRCRIHNKVTSAKYSDHRCDNCKKSNARRLEVLEWLQAHEFTTASTVA